MCEGPAGGAHPPAAARLVRGPALDPLRDPPAGGDQQEFREKGRRLVRALYRGSHTTVRARGNPLLPHKGLHRVAAADGGLMVFPPGKQSLKPRQSPTWLCTWLRTVQVRQNNLESN